MESLHDADGRAVGNSRDPRELLIQHTLHSTQHQDEGIDAQPSGHQELPSTNSTNNQYEVHDDDSLVAIGLADWALCFNNGRLPVHIPVGEDNAGQSDGTCNGLDRHIGTLVPPGASVGQGGVGGMEPAPPEAGSGDGGGANHHQPNHPHNSLPTD